MLVLGFVVSCANSYANAVLIPRAGELASPVSEKPADYPYREAVQSIKHERIKVRIEKTIEVPKPVASVKPQPSSWSVFDHYKVGRAAYALRHKQRQRFVTQPKKSLDSVTSSKKEMRVPYGQGNAALETKSAVQPALGNPKLAVAQIASAAQPQQVKVVSTPPVGVRMTYSTKSVRASCQEAWHRLQEKVLVLARVRNELTANVVGHRNNRGEVCNNPTCSKVVETNTHVDQINKEIKALYVEQWNVKAIAVQYAKVKRAADRAARVKGGKFHKSSSVQTITKQERKLKEVTIELEKQMKVHGVEILAAR